ncbi:MAG: hypothetical protein ABI867_04755 [Kofleriaceae bacterium]
MRWWLVSLAVSACVKFTPPDVVVDDALPIVPDAGPCETVSQTCAGELTLRSCIAVGVEPVDSECTWGCVTTGATGHCGALTPTGGALTAEQIDSTTFGGLADFTLSGTIDSTSGTFNGAVPANVDVSLGAGVVVFRFKSLLIDGPVNLVGSRAIVLVAAGPISVTSTITGTSCGLGSAGPGGFLGANANTAAAGPGGGLGGGGGGGAGGGHAGLGGSAGNNLGGSAFGDAAITTLVGGGAGGGGSGGGNSGRGGGGGGALQLVSNTGIAVSSLAAINLGGCGGRGAPSSNDGGGGGGAGGTVLLEAPQITVAGTIAVNGGGGGASGTSIAGENGRASRAQASGGTGDTADGARGASGSTTAGTTTNNGGGGGAIGRLRFTTRTGAVTVDGATLSPDLGDVATPATVAIANIQ